MPGSGRWPAVCRMAAGFLDTIFNLTRVIHIYIMVAGGETMAKTYRGSPIITVRLPGSMWQAVKSMASDRGWSSSDLIRWLITREIDNRGYVAADKTIDGQVRIE